MQRTFNNPSAAWFSCANWRTDCARSPAYRTSVLQLLFHCTRAVVPHLIRGGGGVVLSASSVVGLYGNFGQTNYGAAKAGIAAFTIICGLELGRYGVCANAIAPVARTRIASHSLIEAMTAGFRSRNGTKRMGPVYHAVEQCVGRDGREADGALPAGA